MRKEENIQVNGQQQDQKSTGSTKQKSGLGLVKSVLRPSYYEQFGCIADKCSFTCCKEWNIAVDQDTYHEWNDYTYDEKKLTSYTMKKEGVRAMKLDEAHRCPFLDGRDLCRLVTQFGDKILSDTCTTFPRQIHEYGDRTESALVSCCPEVIDLMNKQNCVKIVGGAAFHSDGVNRSSLEEEAAKQITKQTGKLCNCNLDDKASLRSIRDTLMDIIQNEKYSLNTELMIIFEVMLATLENKGITYKELQEFKSDVYLEKMAKDIESMEFDEIGTFLEDNELYLDLVENYRKEGFYEKHLTEAAKLAEYFEDILTDEENFEEASEEEQEKKQTLGNQIEKIEKMISGFKIQFSEYEPLFRKYLASEFFTNALLPDSSLENFVVMVQWISLQYAGIRHAIFLKWALQYEINNCSAAQTDLENRVQADFNSAEQAIAYTDVRDSIVLISRITGYDQEDIFEYLDNSFQSRIWEWGYQALIIGQ